VYVTGWSRDLSVEIAGRDVINHAGAAVLRLLADGTGLTMGLSRALARSGFVPVHDRGRVLADTAVLIADGGRVLADLATLRDQSELYGPVASDPTLWRALDEIGEPQRHKIARVRAATREHVWSLIAQRHGQIPPSRVADRDLGKTIVIRMDASLVISHSDKELAAGTYKGSWGHHPLMAWCDNTGESSALLLRKGSAGSNTVADHIDVLDEAIRQIPAPYRRNLLITVDGAGSSHGLIDHITTLNASPSRRVHYSIGWELGARERAAIGRVPSTAWDHVLDGDGAPRDLGEAGVVELTALLREHPAGDQLENWPTDLRIIARREKPHPGAQLSLFEEADGWRYQLLATNTPGSPAQFLEALCGAKT
jgi:Transposase DDE domain group 1